MTALRVDDFDNFFKELHGYWPFSWQREFAAAEMHDWGKADERFQALMLRSDVTEVWCQPTLWAKSIQMPSTRQEYEWALRRSGLPRGFRHEVLSAILARASDGLRGNGEQRDLILHLIATHHGRCRPFPPPVIDQEPPPVDLSALKDGFSVDTDQRQAFSRQLAAGCANRFWRVLRRYGWWGVCYLEAILRLADQQASAEEDESDKETGDQETTRDLAGAAS